MNADTRAHDRKALEKARNAAYSSEVREQLGHLIRGLDVDAEADSKHMNALLGHVRRDADNQRDAIKRAAEYIAKDRTTAVAERRAQLELCEKRIREINAECNETIIRIRAKYAPAPLEGRDARCEDGISAQLERIMKMY